MTTEVASAAVAILPTFKGNYRDLERLLGPSIDRAARQNGRTYGAAFTSSFMASPALQRLIAAGGVGGLLFAGFDRLSAIDTAESKLGAMGKTAGQVESIMKSANDAVIGTQFALSEAATQAAAATAVGIKQGQALTSYLTLIADTAATTSSSLGDIGMIFNQITAAGRVYTQDANQLVQRTVPVWDLIAKAYGTTAAESRKLVEQGKVDAQTFFNAIDGYIGGTAKNMDSFQANLANMRASLGRIGAGLLGGDLDAPKEAIKGITEALKSAEPAAAAIGTVLTGTLTALNAVPPPMLAAAAAALLLSKNSAAFVTAGSRASTTFRTLATSAGSARIMVASAGGEIVATTARMQLLQTAGAGMMAALGGPAGLAIAGTTLALGGLITVLQQGEQATQEQKAAIDELTASLDQNTGAATANTYATISKQLQESGVLDNLERLGISVAGIGKTVVENGPAMDRIKQQLQGIIDLNWAQGYNGQRYLTKTGQEAQVALANLTLKTKDQDQSVRQLNQSNRAAGKTNEELASSFDSVSDAIADAFSGLNGLAAQDSAVRGLAEAIVENGKAINATSKGGVANLDALQGTISAMAVAAGDDYGKFVGNVSGLMQYLDSQGVATQNVMGAVRAAVSNVAGKRWAMYFDASQTLAETNKVIAAMRAAVAGAVAAQTMAGPAVGNALKELGQFDKMVRDAARSTAGLESTFRGVQRSGGGASSGVSKTGKSAKQAAAEVKALRAELYALARDWLKPNRYSSEANSVIDQINAAYKESAVSKKNRDALLKVVKRDDLRMQAIAAAREKQAEKIDKATQALQDAIAIRDEYRDRIITGFRDLMNVTKYTSDVSSTIKALQDGYRALGSLTKFAGEVEKTITTSYRQGDKAITVSQVVKQKKNAASMIAALRDQVKAASAFQANLAQLRKLGLNDTSLDNLLQDFLSSGDGATVSELLKGGRAAVTEVNTLVNQLGNLGGKTLTVAEQQAATRKSITDGLKSQLDQAKKFKSAYNQLQTLGLNDTSLAQLMDEFLSSGDSSRITALLAGGKGTVNELNNLMADMAKVTGNEKSGWAKSAAEDMYGVGVNAADSYLKGLQSRDSALKKQYEKMADDLLATIKKKLGIKSPSREMGKLAEYTSQGWNNNLHLDPVTPGVDVSTGSNTFDAAGIGLIVYVENPWTGEQVRAHTVAVARGVADDDARARLHLRRTGVRS